MDCKKIIEDGYGKLAEYLPETDKKFLEGMKQQIETLKNIKCDYVDIKNNSILEKIKNEVAIEFIDYAIERLENEVDEFLISFVDNNDYMIDKNGVVYKYNERV